MNGLHEMLAPHVAQCVVVAMRESRGPKSGQRDALALAEALRLGAVPRQVYPGVQGSGGLQPLPLPGEGAPAPGRG